MSRYWLPFSSSIFIYETARLTSGHQGVISSAPTHKSSFTRQNHIPKLYTYHQGSMTIFRKKILAFTALILALVAINDGAPTPEGILENVGNSLNSTERVNSPIVPFNDGVISSGRAHPAEDRINPSARELSRVIPSDIRATSSDRVHSRDRQLNDHLIHLETGVCFQDCIFNPNADNMCTFSFVEHSNWQSHAVLHIYDNHCNQIGENTKVTRDSLASPQGWGMSSELPFYLVLHIPRLWNQDSPGEVKWDYGNYRNMGAFTNNPFGDTFASTYRIPSVFKTGDREGSYTVGRAGFICK
ncbi:hypothetical protein BKA64DRAFT_676271 [Cadophora sp. MPI-SDFR-AT-0126]|nr:hypothetical protein BKA64DRAFT_676271 [Leotiomycetes sp. MPI-SDFR-AT-0126]